GTDGPFLRALRDAGLEFAFNNTGHQFTEDELVRALDGIDAALAGSEPYTPRVMDAHPQLRVIARVGVGYDAVDVPGATARGKVVCFAPNTNQDAVAEHTFCLLLALVKNLVSQHLGTCAGKWPRRANLPLRGKTLGIAGMGRIGKAVALRGEVFKMKLL